MASKKNKGSKFNLNDKALSAEDNALQHDNPDRVLYQVNPDNDQNLPVLRDLRPLGTVTLPQGRTKANGRREVFFVFKCDYHVGTPRLKVRDFNHHTQEQMIGFLGLNPTGDEELFVVSECNVSSYFG